MIIKSTLKISDSKKSMLFYKYIRIKILVVDMAASIFRLIFPCPCTDMCKRQAVVLRWVNLSQKRRKSEPKEEEK